MEKQATIVFDFDGTLANSVDLIFKLYNDHAAQFGYLPVSKGEIPALRRMGYKKAMKTKKIRFRKVPNIILLLGRKMRARMNEVAPYDGIVESLHALQQQGFSVGILTSNQAPLVNDFLTTHGFPSLDFVVSEKTLFGKNKALKKIIRRFGLDKEQVVYVGDEPRDVIASRKAGVQVIGVSWGIGGKEGFEATPPDAIVNTPKELLATIKDMAKV